MICIVILSLVMSDEDFVQSDYYKSWTNRLTFQYFTLMGESELRNGYWILIESEMITSLAF